MSNGGLQHCSTVLTRAACVLAAIACAGFAPPTGRPPVGPLQRIDPKVYDFQFSVLMKTAIPRDLTVQERFNIAETPIMFPILFIDTFNRVRADSVRFSMMLENTSVTPTVSFNSTYAQNTTLATLTVGQFGGQVIRWQADFTTQVWSSLLNDEQAAATPWPDEWPAEVKDALKPQLYIESDDAMFSGMVQRALQRPVRDIPVFYAAKELVRYCVNQIQTTGDGEDRAELNTLRGMTVNGAFIAARDGRGSPHDLVCVCVAVLRAAGIPARSVIGAQEDVRGRVSFVSWAEFYLPDAGWVPFDPYVMRGKGIRTLDVRRPWSEFGTMDELNERIPLAHHFMPPVSCEAPGSPGLWGWQPRPARPNLGVYQIYMDISSRGQGVGDPR